MMLIEDENHNKMELNYRPLSDPKEMLYQKSDRKDLIVTIILYIIMIGLVIYKLGV